MTITLQLWVLFPALLVFAGVVLMALGARETGMLGGCFHAALALALFLAAGAFLLGRWLA